VGWAVKTCHCTRHARYCSATDPPQGKTRRLSYPKIPRARPYPFPVNPPRPGLDQPSVKKEQGLHATGPEVFSPSHPLHHHGAQGWPAIPGACRYSSFHNARQNFTSKAPPWRLCLPLALLMQKWICKHKGLIPEIDIQSVPVDLTC
jgi:hypothetical protein